MNYNLIIFPTTHNLFLAEELLEKHNYKLEIVPTPDDEEDCCSLSIKIKCNNINKVEEMLQTEIIRYVKIKK
ncbi:MULTISPECIES: DUF3343 domain-containing protein [unclassified Candidatus Frackibacter]|uniref:DUF3343 domain-containing protein n=1 Tax=unclassified Candidatus Frackibacter TaxID=2648818 RepID=UPI0007981D99|nr:MULTISPECIES: DUF3343 domain-containing protein [unclassified Candidatus Frackibacter]KXS40551.1 MAG: hypothetical protein AWU54_1935 [Candidatus Frackibacter sp. T328-2]SDC27601.1 Protein of unknown function [Candidatus Frackibacter sp. WG11]SEM54520.1 Protein of unknown function [Candidatus Frackibacter sp. WG12]SFL53846.1 Protein of unknown function [Candidatus Frackibacter sp. WG13]